MFYAVEQHSHNTPITRLVACRNNGKMNEQSKIHDMKKGQAILYRDHCARDLQGKNSFY